MDFSQVASEFHNLKAQYDAGTLSEADFKTRLQDLMIQDEQGRWWMIGYETGQWYVHDGEKWVRGEPPIVEAPPAMVTAEPEKPIFQPSTPAKAAAQPPAPARKLWLWVGAVIIGVVSLAFLISRLSSGPTPPPLPSTTSTATSTLTATASPSPNAPLTSTPTATRTQVTFSVTDMLVKVDPQSFSGACPTTFQFTANITTNAPGNVTYQWERSDGASGQATTVAFAAAESRMINTTWYIGAPGTYWERIRVLSPNDVVSNEATFTLACEEATSPLLFVDAEAINGRISRLDGETESTIYKRPSGQIHSLAPAKNDSIYFCNANKNAIYRLQGNTEETVYTHSTYVREVEIGPGGAVYFSEATGAGGDGVIYRLNGTNAVEFYRIRLSDVDGSWAGTFAFAGNGDLWLSSGNQIPANLYHVVGGAPQRVYTASDEAIMGFAFESTGNLIYANHNNTIVRLVLPSFARQIVQVIPSAQRLSDVALAMP